MPSNALADPLQVHDGFWASLGMGSESRELLYVNTQTAVFRIATRVFGGLSVIVKVTRSCAAAEREQAAQQLLAKHALLSQPRILASGQEQALCFLVYEDLHLVPARFSRQSVQGALALAEKLHQTPVEEDLPATVASHTPPLQEVWSQVQEWPWQEYWQSLFEKKAKKQLLHLFASSPLWISALALRPKVLCHGDLHFGNVMQNQKTARLHLIDWEFLHADYAYFDLFQLLDATSPFTPLQRCGERTLLLASYNREFICGYLHFAAIHLFWILRRIAEDLAEGRHDAVSLQRQQGETVAGLVSVAHELARDNPQCGGTYERTCPDWDRSRDD